MEKLLCTIFFLLFLTPTFVQAQINLASTHIKQNNEKVNLIIGDISYLAIWESLPNKNTNEVLRIKTHLAYVEKLLKKADTSKLSDDLKKIREENIKRLHFYWTRGIFPKNYDYLERRPCFIDKNGNICAAGYLIAETAGLEIAQKINAKYKYAAVYEMDMPEIESWIAKSGLTKYEIAMIQPTYAPASPWIEYINRGDVEAVKLLIKTKLISLNGLGSNGAGGTSSTPLCMAILGNQVEIAKLLLDAGADPNVSSSEYPHSSLPLELALSSNNPEFLKLLLAAKVKPYVEDRNILLNLVSREPELAKQIISNLPERKIPGDPAADFFSKLSYDNLFDMAIRAENIDFLKLVVDIKKINVNELIDGDLPLSIAIEFSDFESVEFLLKEGARLDLVFEHPGYSQEALRKTLLRKSSMKLTKLLVSHGLKLDDKFYSELFSNLMFNVTESRPEVEDVKLLFIEGFEPDKQSYTRALISSVASPKITEILIDFGIKKDAAGFSGAFSNALGAALRIANLESVNLFLKIGTPLNFTDTHNPTALFSLFSCYSYQKEIIDITRMLIKSGVDINKENAFNNTALIVLMENNKLNQNFELIKLMVESGANINQKGRFGETPLSKALNSSSLKIVEFLLEKGADINLKDDFGRTPLFSGIEGGIYQENILDKAKALINKGASIYEKNNYEKSLIAFACERKNLQIIELLLQLGAKKEDFLNAGFGRYLEEEDLSNISQIKNIKTLLKLGFSLNSQDKNGNTLLIWCASRSPELFKQLDLEGVDLKLKNKEGKTVLNVFLDSLIESRYLGSEGVERLDALEFLLIKANKDDFLASNINLEKLLLKAAELNKTDLVKLLLKLNPNLNFKDEKGNSALTIATENGYLKTAHLLLKAGVKADSESLKNVKISGSELLLSYARDITSNEKQEHFRIVKELIESKEFLPFKNILAKSAKEALFAAINSSDVGDISDLISCGVDINVKNNEGDSPLIFAVKSMDENETLEDDLAHIEIVKILLNANAKKELRDSEGNTALLNACIGHHPDALELLIKAGANVNALNFEKENAFTSMGKITFLLSGRYSMGYDEYYQESPYKTQEERLKRSYIRIVKMLFDAGFRLKAKDNASSLLFNRYKELDSIFIKAGAKLLPSDMTLDNLLAFAERGSFDLVNKIISSRRVKLTKEILNKLFLGAIKNNNLDMVNNFLALGADINYKDDVGTLALSEVLAQNNLEILEAMLKHDPNFIEKIAPSDKSNIAPYAKDPKIVALLLEKGSGKNGKFAYTNAILSALLEANLEVANLLLDRSDDINTKAVNRANVLAEVKSLFVNYPSQRPALLGILKLLTEKGEQ